mgnify:CR=1 FL=1
MNNPKRNPLINLGAGLWDLYNNLTGLLSDVLSYIRLFAIGLSGGVLALVFNTLASGFVPEGANIVVRLLIMIPILLIGHGINLFMSTISSFVHPMRLTFSNSTKMRASRCRCARSSPCGKSSSGR